MQMTIELDREKIEAESSYSLAELYRCVDETFKAKSISVDWDGQKRIYVDHSENALANMGECLLVLEKCDWFMRYVSFWHWITDDNEEDVLEELHKYEDES